MVLILNGIKIVLYQKTRKVGAKASKLKAKIISVRKNLDCNRLSKLELKKNEDTIENK